MANQTPCAVKVVVLLYASLRSKLVELFKKSPSLASFTPWLSSYCHDRGQVRAGPEDKQNEYSKPDL